MYNSEQLYVRELAKEVAELTHQPRVLSLKEEWIAHNELKDHARTMILAFPEAFAWTEILPEESLHCQNPTLRAYERNLKRTLFGLKELKDDTPHTATFGIPYRTQISGYGKGLDAIKNESTSKGGSYHYERLINDIVEEFDRLEFRTITHNQKASEEARNDAESTLGDILKVEYRGEQWWTLGITWEVIKLIGLEELMYNMYDEPEGLHQLMGWFTKEHLNMMQQVKDLGILTPNDGNIPIASGGYGWTNELKSTSTAPLDYKNKWGFAESQETVGISPDFFGEFIFPYQLPLLEKFGLNCYGCCEPLEERWEWVSQIPRLRRVSVSPWSDVMRMKEILGKDYIYSRKVNPAYLCVGNDTEALRNQLAEVASFSHDVHMEIIMKDIQTLQNDPARVINWVKMAREELAKVE